jgi:hypothetical protein
MDGPVVTAARQALETANANLILPWVPKEAEKEICEAFDKTLRVRKLNEESRALADYWFFETVVRLHRAGEGAPYTGLKPAGLDPGPVVPRAEKALEQRDPGEVIEFLVDAVHEVLHEKFDAAISRKDYDANNVDDAREYVEAMLGFIVYSHHLYTVVQSGGNYHEGGHGGHEH